MTDREIRDKVKEVLFSNKVQGYSKSLNKNFTFIQPSPKKYNCQYFWDSCFHVFMLCKLGEYELAKKDLLSLFELQTNNGFVGHMGFWNKSLKSRIAGVLQSKPKIGKTRPHTSALIQPPLVAQAVLKVYEETKDKLFLEEILPKLKNYFNWLNENRDFEKDGLLSIIAPFESGLDYKPSFDEVLGFNHGMAKNSLFLRAVLGVELRNYLNMYNLKKIYEKGYFIVKETLVNTFYSLDLKALSELGKLANDPDAKTFLNRSQKTAKSILEKMYDPESNAFYDLYGKESKKSKNLTFTSLLPAALEEIPSKISDKVIEKHLFKNNNFQTPYPIPSVPVNCRSFSPFDGGHGLWRGPTWALPNWFLFKLLNKKGLTREADKLKKSVKNLIEKSGFREYYNPFTGEGYGEKNFTWSGLILDMV